EPETVFAVARHGATIGGFLHLVPSAHGYSLGAMRRDPATPNGLMEYLIIETLAWARDECADELSLNFCVFADLLADPEGRLQNAARGVLRAGDRVFQLERLLRFSRKFSPEWRPRYVCVERLTDLPLVAVEKVVEEELGLTIEQLFTEFEERPVAAASIGQVHRATLPNGRRVAVKIQRPGAPRQIEADLALLYQAARIAKERVRALDFIDARQLVDEFARSIRQELDYRLEARNADVFHRNFAGHPHVRVPRVYWSYTRSRVLTLEWLEGTQVADIHPEEWSVEGRRDLAYLMAETWMTMIFRHGF